MSVLITGGMGFIGIWLARALVEQGEEIVLFDVAIDRKRIKGIEDKVKVVQGDLKLWPEVFDLIQKYRIDGIYHLGTMTSLPSELHPWASFQVNVIGTMHILEAARLLGVKKVVFTSTADTFGLGITDTITDWTIQRPINIYGCTKLAAETFGRWYKRERGLDFRAVRICAAVMGPGVKTPATSQYNAWMIEAAAMGRPYACYVTPETRVPVMYIKDMVRALLMLYEAPIEQIETIIYNVGGVRPANSARELEIAVKKHIPEAKITYNPDPVTTKMLSQQIDVAVDDNLAKKEFGWEPLYKDLDGLVGEFIAEVRRHPELYELE